MSLYRTIAAVLFIMICITACSGPQKLYEKGKYGRAYDKALNQAKKKKDRKMKTLLNKAFSKMIDQTRDELEPLRGNYALGDVERNLSKYDKVRERFEDGQAQLSDDNIKKYRKIEDEKEALVNNVYNDGRARFDDFFDGRGKVAARDAYYHFLLVNEYCQADYDDIDQLLRDAKEAGTVVYNVQSDLGFDTQYKWEVDRRFDDMEGYEDFQRVIYNGFGNQGDCLVELDFDRLDVDLSTRTSSDSYSKEVEDGYTIKTDTSGRETKIPKYTTVSGTVQTKNTTKTVSWRVALDVRSMTGDCDLREERFSRYVSEEVEQYVTSGDSRAIPTKYTNAREERLPSTDDMVDDLIDQLYRDISQYIYR